MINFNNLLALYPGHAFYDLWADEREDWDALVDISERIGHPVAAVVSVSAFEKTDGTFFYHTYVSADGENFARLYS